MSGGEFAETPQSYIRQFLHLWWIPLMVALEAATGGKPIPVRLVVILIAAATCMAGADYWFFVRKGWGKMITPGVGMLIGVVIFAVSAFFWYQQRNGGASTISQAPPAIQKPKKSEPERQSMSNGSDPTKSTYSIGNVTGSGNIVTQGQTGGNNVINQAPAPQARMIRKDDVVKNSDGTYLQTWHFEVVAPYPPGNMVVTAQGSQVRSLYVFPEGSDTLQVRRGSDNGVYFCAIASPFGNYKILVTTTDESEPTLQVLFNRR